MINKLDPHLRVRTKALRGAAAEPAAPGERVEVIVALTGDIADLEAVGFTPRSVFENPPEPLKIVTGSVPVDRLEELAAVEHVVEVEGPRRLHPLLNYSVPEIHADALHDETPSRKGIGVVVGVIDTGIDWRHPDFIQADGKTSRILALWDQINKPGAGDQAGPNGLGVEYLQQDISNAIQGQKTLQTNDSDKDDGHGTHVAGIAAGSGAAACCCHGTNTYVGVAPLADLIIVKRNYHAPVLGENVHLADAVNYIFNHPQAAGKAVVINISLGGNVGPHDGTSLLEQAINTAVSAQAGRVVVVAAGNSANLDPDRLETLCHVTTTVAGNSQAEIDFQVRDGYERSAFLDLWYDRGGALNLEVVADGGATSGVVNDGASKSFPANPGAAADHAYTVDIVGTTNGPFSRNNNFRVSINKPKKGNLPKGDNWKLKLTNPGSNPVSLHCWIDRGDHGPVFLPPANPPDGKIRASKDSTLTIPGTAAGAITVANHASKTSCCDCWPADGIIISSSRGPVARDAAHNPKPDIAAPGLEITAAQADPANGPGHCCSCCPDACCCLYHDLNGTSMAAPHVTGTVALMFEADPTLTRDAVLKALQDSATAPPAPGTKEAWGAGKLNALAAVNGVLPGGGGGGSPHIVAATAEDAPFDPVENSALDRRLHGLPPAVQILRSRVEALPGGIQLAAAISRHFSEVRRLINHNRRIATMWHRSEGPRMLRRAFLGAMDPHAPAAIRTPLHREYFDRWFDLLLQYGSPALKRGITQYRSALLEFLALPLAAQLESHVEVVS
jgi:subtilisin family serine protease